MTITNDSAIEKFLKSCSVYAVLHEASPSKSNLEHYFIAVANTDITSHVVKGYINKYQESYPLLDISEVSKKYISMKKDKHQFIFIDTLDKSDVFFAENETFLKNNISNILAIRMVGEPVDLQNHIGSKAEKYFTQFKKISISASSVAKDELKNGLELGAKKLNEKAPLIKQKLEDIKKKVMKPK